MESPKQQPGLSKIDEVPGAIKEIDQENSSEDVSSEHDKSLNNKSKQSNEKSLDTNECCEVVVLPSMAYFLITVSRNFSMSSLPLSTSRKAKIAYLSLALTKV